MIGSSFNRILYSSRFSKHHDLLAPRSGMNPGRGVSLFETFREPPALTVTVPSDYKARRLVKDGVCVLRKAGVSLHRQDTAFIAEGHLVPCYDLERTILDILRSHSQMDMQIVLAAVNKSIA